MSLSDYIVRRIRLELGDEPAPFEASFFGDGIEFQFLLDQRPLKEGSLSVTLDGRPFDAWEMDYKHGTMLFAEPPPAGATVYVAGIKYRYFSDEDLCIFANEAVNEHSRSRTDVYGMQMGIDNIPVVEHHLIALRATVLALWALVTDAAFDIDISAPDGVHIPRSERFGQLMGLLAAKEAEYKEMAQALNVGLFRIEVYTLRRIAKRTNRLVPLYMSQEYDDPRPPQRVYTEQSLQGSIMPDESVLEQVLRKDLVLRKRSAFSADISLGRDVTALISKDGELSAEVLLYPGAAVPRARFEVEVLNPRCGEFRLTMDPEHSRFVPDTQSYWQLVLRNEDDGGVLLAQGVLRAERPVTRKPGDVGVGIVPYVGG